MKTYFAVAAAAWVGAIPLAPMIKRLTTIPQINHHFFLMMFSSF
jgi:hypothetical protein